MCSSIPVTNKLFCLWNIDLTFCFHNFSSLWWFSFLQTLLVMLLHPHGSAFKSVSKILQSRCQVEAVCLLPYSYFPYFPLPLCFCLSLWVSGRDLRSFSPWLHQPINPRCMKLLTQPSRFQTMVNSLFDFVTNHDLAVLQENHDCHPLGFLSTPRIPDQRLPHLHCTVKKKP